MCFSIGTTKIGQREGGIEGTIGGGNGRIAVEYWTFTENGKNVEERGTEEWESRCTERKIGGELG